MDLDKLNKFAKLYETKVAQEVLMENIDTAAPVVQYQNFQEELMNALTAAAEAGVVSQGDVFDIGIAVGPNNRVVFRLNPANPQMQALLSKHVGPALTRALNSNKIHGNGFVMNQWVSGWGWV